jgi:hypothetical protein
MADALTLMLALNAAAGAPAEVARPPMTISQMRQILEKEGFQRRIVGQRISLTGRFSTFQGTLDEKPLGYLQIDGLLSSLNRARLRGLKTFPETDTKLELSGRIIGFNYGIWEFEVDAR